MTTAGRGKQPVRRARRRSAARRRAGIAALGVTATGLIAGGVLLPQLPGGAGLAIDDTASSAAVSAPTPPAQSNSVVGSPQLVVPVPAAPVPPSYAVPRPAPRRIELPRPWVPYGVSPKTSPPPASCGGYSTPRRIPPGVVAGTGSATLSWRADNHGDVQGYRVRAVSQQLVTGTQPDPPTQSVAQVTGCATISATMTGLTSGVYYVFWLEEGQLDKASGVIRYVQVGETEPVRIG